MDARLLKEKALHYFQKAKFAKAAEVWAQVCAVDPRDNQSRLRLGDALSKAGQLDKAFEAYRAAAEGFVRAGFLPQATAAAKLALGLKPAAVDVQTLLSDLYAERFGRAQSSGSGVVSSPEFPVAPPFESSPSRGPSTSLPGQPLFVSSRSSAARLMPAKAPVSASSVQRGGDAVAPARPEVAHEVALEDSVVVELGEERGSSLADEVLASARPPPRPQRPLAPPPQPPPPPLDDTGAGFVAPKPARRPPFRLVRPVESVGPAPRGTETGSDAVWAPPPVPPRSPAPSPRPSAEAPEAVDIELSSPMVQRPSGEVELAEAPNPDATRLGNAVVMEELRRRSALQDSTVVAVNPLLVPAPTTPDSTAPGVEGDEAELRRGEYPRIPLFDGLSSEAFLALVRGCPLREYSIHEVVLEQGRPGSSFFVILAGRVRVFREEGGGRRELAILEEGGFFGEMALLTGAPRSAWVVAEVDGTKLLEISSKVVRDLSVRYPSVAEGLASLARKRILSNVMATEPIFAGLKRNERLALADRFQVREAGPGEVLLTEGARPSGLTVVVSGQLRRAGKERAPKLYGTGTLLGDLDSLQGVVAETVEVHRPGLLLTLAQDEVARLLGHPSLVGKGAALLEAARRRLG